MKSLKYTIITLILMLLMQGVKAQCPVRASFAHSSTGLVAFFTSTTIGASSSTTYSWDFGDLTRSTLQNPSHTYTTPGTYTVILEAWDSVGGSPCFDSIHTQVIVPSSGCRLTSSFTNTSSGLTTSFTNTSTPITPSTTYYWRFGDGTFSTQQNPIHTYTTAGTYYAGVEVSDTAGGYCFDSVYNFVTVTSSSSCSIPVSFLYNFTGLSGNFYSSGLYTSSSVKFLWNFGDGTTSNLPAPNHTYLSGGSYTVKLIASDTAGGIFCSDSISTLIIIPFLGTGCSMSSSFSHSSIGLTTSFNSTVIGASSDSAHGLLFNWDFGDGDSSKLSDPTHTYSAPGTYSVSVIINDSLSTTGGRNCIDTLYATITVSLPSSSCFVNVSFTETISGLSANLNSTSTGFLSPTTYSWNFGDGSSGTGSSTSHTYSSQGVYSVTLTVSDSLCSDSSTRIIAVTSNVFTPNGDGIDDIFPLPCSGAAANVYNSSGVLIKTLPIGSLNWDGTNNLGGLESTGLYFIVCASSSTPIPVTLIR